MTERSNVSVLLSGGIDSSACVSFYLQRKLRVEALFVDYGQAAATEEQRAATRVSRYYDIPVRSIILNGARPWKGGSIPGRNALLLYIAMMNREFGYGLVAIGIHAGTDYWDCCADFVNATQKCFDEYTNGRLQIDAPFLEWYKQEIWTYCLQTDVPVERTYSCEIGLPEPCGQCLSCKDVARLHGGYVEEGIRAKPGD